MHAVAPTGRQVVDHVHRVPVRDEGVHDVGADEAGATGDEDPHVPRSCRGTSRWCSRRPSSTSTRGSHPSSVRARADVGLADLGVVDRKRAEHDLAPGAGEAEDALGQLEQRHLVRVADVDRVVRPAPA